MSRQFTDGEIVATIKALAVEGKALTRASVRDRLGGGGSTRISALLKEYDAGTYGTASPRSGPTTDRSARSGPKQSGPTSEKVTAPQAPPARPVAPSAPAQKPGPSVDPTPDAGIHRLESEIRVLKILLEEERGARREDEARHQRTIEALQREIEIANRGRP